MIKIGIIGGGISGLVAAYLLKDAGHDVILFEKNAVVGGNISTRQIDGYLIEQGPNSLLRSPALVDLINKLDLREDILPANPSAKKRYVLKNGRLQALPMSVLGLVFGDLFSFKAKLRMLKEPFIRTVSNDGESVAQFFERRLGKEIVQNAADPFIAGIYAGQAEKLSMRAAFPTLFGLEKKYKSLFIGSLSNRTPSVDGSFPRSFTFRSGVETLTKRIAEKLGPSMVVNTEIGEIKKEADDRWLVRSENSEDIFDAVIIATPAPAASRLLAEHDADLSRALDEIYYPPVAMVFFGMKYEDVGINTDGFGFLVPSAERREILGTLWNSSVFGGRAPEGYQLFTTFIGGARNADIFDRSDEELFDTALRELKEILDLKAMPEFRHVKRWQRAIPQYDLGYEKVEAAINAFEQKNRSIYFCSNFYKGISVGDCVKNAFELAVRICHEYTNDKGMQKSG